MMKPGEERDSDRSQNGIRYAGLGLQLMSSVLLFGGLGYLADRRWGSTPWGMAAGATIGLAAGMYFFLKKVL
jgi:F0F1-type ATP synthase assembly protein I